MTDSERNTAGSGFPPILIPALALAGSLALESIAPFGFLSEPLTPGWQLAAGIALALAGAVIVGTSSAALQRARATQNPNKTELTLISAGPYRFTRNPIYVAFLLFQAGIAFAYSLEWGLVLLAVSWLALDRLVIAREEAYLTRLFGAEYQALLKTTRRWL